MSSSRQNFHRRLLVGAIGLGLASWAVCSLLPSVTPSSSRSSLRSERREGSSIVASQPPSPLTKSPAPSPRSVSPAHSPLAAARDAYRALKRHFGAPHGLFSKYADDPKYAGAWAVAQAMDGAVGLSKLPGGGVASGQIEDLFHALRFYWDGSARTPGYDKAVRAPLGPGGHKFYDDNALIGLALVQGYKVTNDPAILARAEQVFDFEKSGWDRNAAHPFPGGIFWKQSAKSHDRNTVSTAGAAQLGLHLYLLTGKQDDLDWAMRMYDWVNSTLRAPNGLYWDHVGLAGKIDKTLWSYNQGLMLGDSVLLSKATGNQTYLQRARAIADKAVAYYRHGNRLDRQRPIINGIFFANLLGFDQLAPKLAYLQAAEGYAAYMERNVDPRTGVLRLSPQPFLLDQASLVQVNAHIALARRGIAAG
jgi:hypothetical protein